MAATPGAGLAKPFVAKFEANAATCAAFKKMPS
jgi:hypothetical protein